MRTKDDDQRRSCCPWSVVSDALRRVHRDEDGQLSVITLIVILGFVLLIAGLFNTAATVQQKVELQNGADALAQAAGTKLARSLNAITAANHLLGEMQALIVLHQALGGDPLDAGNRRDLTPRAITQRVSQAVARAREESVTVPPPAAEQIQAVTSPVLVEGAMGDARLQLKKVAAYALELHALGAFLVDKAGDVPFLGPYFRAVGQTLVQAAGGYLAKIMQEWQTLDAVETLARSQLLAAKQSLQGLLPDLHALSLSHRSEAGDRLDDAAEAIAERHSVTPSLFPSSEHPSRTARFQLPVMPEPVEFSGETLPRSQLVRASTPWVQYWRLPLLQFGQDALPLSRFKSYYVAHTQQETLTQAARWKSQGVHLLILQDYDPRSQAKGTEPWTTAEGSRLADQRFAVMSFAQRATLLQMGAACFPNVHPDGLAAYAQTMVYNANPQRPELRDPLRQRQVGYDTLNWLGTTIPEWEAGNDPNPTGNTPVQAFRDQAPEPVIAVNWQSLLVPATRIEEAARAATGSLGRLLDRTPVDRNIARTH